MSPNALFLDVDTVSTLASDLYHSCHLLSPGAPDGFGQLFNELAPLHGILRVLYDHPNSKSSFGELSESRFGQAYEVADVALDQKQYKAILLIESRLSFRHSSIYYLYRDVDYTYDSHYLHVKLPKIFYVNYISSHLEQLYQAANNVVFFSHCEKKIGNMEVFFSDEPVLQVFMSSLASSYEFCFSQRAEFMTTKKQSFLSSKKSTKGETEVQLWRKGHSIQLASRWANHAADRWLTMSVPSGSSRNISRDSNRIELPATTYSRGTILKSGRFHQTLSHG